MSEAKKLYSFEYDSTYDPALPVVRILVSSFGRTAPSLFLTALIDSGADGTMLPLAALREIGARQTDQVIVRGVSGTRFVADIYKVSIRIGPHAFPLVRVVADRRNHEAIVGRDVLNQMIVTLNGLAAVTEIPF